VTTHCPELAGFCETIPSVELAVSLRDCAFVASLPSSVRREFNVSREKACLSLCSVILNKNSHFFHKHTLLACDYQNGECARESEHLAMRI
jgi:hypothetical protein